jgi:8-oxo-dGTP pyrophosphatase MutT (NUDIX family)
MREPGDLDISVPEVQALVEAFEPTDDAHAMASVDQTLELLQYAAFPFDRVNYDPGHVTASAAVLSPDRHHVLLVYHERLGRWLQPGGHIERGHATVQDAARREVREETGLQLDDTLPSSLVTVDVHEIPSARGEPMHMHFDLMFHFVAPARATPHDGHQALWCPIADLPRFGADGALMRGVARALRSSSFSRD